MDPFKLGHSIKRFGQRVKAAASGASNRISESSLSKSMQETFKEKQKAILNTDIFNDIHSINIADVIFEVDDIPNIFTPLDEDPKEVTTLMVKVFQDKYPATKFSGLPRVPDTTHDKDLLKKILKFYFEKERATLIKHKKKGNSISLRSKIDHLQKVNILLNHFTEDSESFPYDKFEEYLEHKDYINAEEDISESLKHVGKTKDEDERVRSLLRQFAKVYLSKKKAHAFTLSDPGISSDQLKELVATEYANKITPTLLDSILKFMDDPLEIERIKDELHAAEIAKDVAQKERDAALAAKDTLKSDIKIAEKARDDAIAAKKAAEAAKKKAEILANEVLRLEREEAEGDSKAALRETRGDTNELLKDSKAALRELKAEAEAAKLDANNKIAEANLKAEQAQAQEAAALAQKAAAEDSKKIAEATAASALNAKAIAEGQRDTAFEQIEKAEAAANEAKQDLANANSELESARVVVSEAYEELTALRNTGSDLEEAEKKLSEAKEKEFAAVQRSYTAEAEKNEALRIQEELSGSLKEKNEELTAIKSELVDLKKEFSELKKKRDEAVEISETLTNNISGLEREANKFKSELNAKQLTKSELEEKIKLLNATLRGTRMSLETERNDAIKEKKEAERKLENTGQYIYELDKNYNAALVELTNTTKELAASRELVGQSVQLLLKNAERIKSLESQSDETMSSNSESSTDDYIDKLLKETLPVKGFEHNSADSIGTAIHDIVRRIKEEKHPGMHSKLTERLLKKLIQYLMPPAESIIPQEGGKLLKHCKKIANDDIYDVPFALIEEFEASSGTDVKRSANQLYMFECFLEEMFDTHFTSNEMKEFYFEAHLLLRTMKADFYNIAQMCYKLLEICNVIQKSKKDIDIVRLKTTELNSQFDTLEQAVKKADYDFFTAANNEIRSEISITFSKDHIYFFKNTNSFVNTYSINSSFNLDEEHYELNEELYFINISVLKLFYTITNYLYMKNKLPNFKLGKHIEKFERTMKRKKNKQSKSIKKLLEERWEKNKNIKRMK